MWLSAVDGAGTGVAQSARTPLHMCIRCTPFAKANQIMCGGRVEEQQAEWPECRDEFAQVLKPLQRAPHTSIISHRRCPHGSPNLDSAPSNEGEEEKECNRHELADEDTEQQSVK
jgi:hypothetical protein